MKGLLLRCHGYYVFFSPFSAMVLVFPDASFTLTLPTLKMFPGMDGKETAVREQNPENKLVSLPAKLTKRTKQVHLSDAQFYRPGSILLVCIFSKDCM